MPNRPLMLDGTVSGTPVGVGAGGVVSGAGVVGCLVSSSAATTAACWGAAAVAAADELA